MTAIVTCHYRVLVPYGTYTYYRADTYDFYVTVTSDKSYELEPIGNGFIVHWLVESDYSGGFEIEYSTSSSFTSSRKKTVERIRKTDVTITGLDANTKYYVRGRVYTLSSGNVKTMKGWMPTKTVVTRASSSSGSSSSSGTQTTVAKPPKTAISKFVSRELGFSVSWKKQTKNTTGYQIQYATNNKFKSGKTKSVKGATNTTVLNLAGGKRYYVRVRTFRTYAGKNHFSGWSPAKSVVTKRVIKPQATRITEMDTDFVWAGYIELFFNKVQNCTGYQLQVSKYSNFSKAQLWTSPGNNSITDWNSISKTNPWRWWLKDNSYSVDLINPTNYTSGTYYFRIRTFNRANGKTYYSSWSNVVSSHLEID